MRHAHRERVGCDAGRQSGQAFQEGPSIQDSGHRVVQRVASQEPPAFEQRGGAADCGGWVEGAHDPLRVVATLQRRGACQPVRDRANDRLGSAFECSRCSAFWPSRLFGGL
jgi:hypothetical protein